MKLIAKLNFKKFNKIFLLYVNFPAKKTANKKMRINPMTYERI